MYVEGHYIRSHEPVLDAMHSLYILQYDWEMAIKKEDRNLQFLKEIVRKIYDGLVKVEKTIVSKYPDVLGRCQLPDAITFMHSEDLESMYPKLTPREREQKITEQYKAVFIIGIGHPLPQSGQPHDDRAADYDDWWSANGTEDYKGLNGDIFIWDNVL